jgi:hypothetical protein
VVRARDRQRDRVECGAGAGDVVEADPFDMVAGCEDVVGPARPLARPRRIR